MVKKIPIGRNIPIGIPIGLEMAIGIPIGNENSYTNSYGI
jgi:hypothetical protein